MPVLCGGHGGTFNQKWWNFSTCSSVEASWVHFQCKLTQGALQKPRTWPPTSNCSSEKFPLIRKEPWAGPGFWFLIILLFLEVIISLLSSPFGWLTHCVYIICFLVCFTALSIKPKQSLWCYQKWSNLIFGVWSSAGDGTVRMYIGVLKLKN